ncbi:hypothetical protein FRC09_007535 [Ceratobasidium sp. 395]|nr:hypothetical protein FRC09_007535 [Ceratobasidium sp. 395]
MGNTCQQRRKSERKERNKRAHSESNPASSEPEAKHQKKAASTISEDELEAGVFANNPDPTEGLEDEDEPDSDQAEHEEFLMDPYADREVSPTTYDQSEARADSTDPEPHCQSPGYGDAQLPLD